jgi:hypothetical protein
VSSLRVLCDKSLKAPNKEGTENTKKERRTRTDDFNTLVAFPEFESPFAELLGGQRHSLAVVVDVVPIET